MRHTMPITNLAEVDASDLFKDEGADWRWCCDNATFTHKEACEFILHIGNPTDILQGDDTIFEETCKSMKDSGCTQDLIDCYVSAKEAGATRVLFYA
jgi:hypothetical protein